MNETTNKATGETIKYNRIGGTPDSPIYFNDPLPPATGTPANITATSLAPANPIIVPQTQQNPIYNQVISDVGTRTQSQIDTAKAEAEALQNSIGNKADVAQKSLTDAVKGLFTDRGNIQASQTALEQQAGIDAEQKALASVNTEIANTNIQLRNEQDRIRNTPMSQGQQAVETGNLQDTFGRRLADLAIRQSAAQGNISAIQADAERKIKIALAPIDNQIQYYTTFGKDNVDYLTKKDQERLGLIVDSLNKQKADITALETAKANMIAEISKNGGRADQATMQAVQNAKDLSSIAQAGSKYIGVMDFLKAQADIAQSKASTAMSYAQLAKLNAETKAIIDKNKTDPATNALRLAQSQGNISTVDKLAKDPAIMGAVGTSFLSRGFLGGATPYKLTGEQQNFIAGVEQMRGQLTLDNLINAKAQGATFGALSEGELKLLNESATKIGKWAIKDSEGNVVGYDTSEKAFKSELDRINNFSKLDYILKGGNPNDIGATITDDGHIWSQNSDGTITQLK